MFLDEAQAINLLEKAVGEKGADYVYPRMMTVGDITVATQCDYFREDQPSCLVGHVLSYLGYDNADEAEGHSASYAMEKLGIEFDDAAAFILEQAQDAQDSGTPWGEAVENARNEYENYRLSH